MIDWTGIDDFEDSEITFMLYMEGLSVSQIVKVRNIDMALVNDHIIKEKLKRRESLRRYDKAIADNVQEEHYSTTKINNNKKEKARYTEVNSYIIMDKEDRLNFIQSISEEDLIKFKRDIYRRMVYEENPDDLMALIWTAGELKDPGYIPLITSMATKIHASIRRLSYSALGKIAHVDGLECLYRGLGDKKPQCRQYAARAIGKIGSIESIEVLKEGYRIEKSRKDSKDYILRAIVEAIEEIENANRK